MLQHLRVKPPVHDTPEHDPRRAKPFNDWHTVLWGISPVLEVDTVCQERGLAAKGCHSFHQFSADCDDRVHLRHQLSFHAR